MIKKLLFLTPYEGSFVGGENNVQGFLKPYQRVFEKIHLKAICAT